MTTLSERHRARLATLLESLDPEGGVHNFFIKCVKPNDRMQPHTHHGGYVARQLRHQGVLQAVALIKEGYPFRVAYAEVHTRYAPLLAQLAATGRPGTKRFAAIGPRGLVMALLRAEELRPTIDYLLGSSRVFLRLGKAQLLERMLSLPPSAVLPELEARLAAQAARVRARIVLRVAMRRCAVGRVRKKERQREAAVSIQSRARVLPARRVVAGKRAEREAAERRAAEEREAEAARLAEEAERLARQQAEANAAALAAALAAEQEAEREREEAARASVLPDISFLLAADDRQRRALQREGSSEARRAFAGSATDLALDPALHRLVFAHWDWSASGAGEGATTRRARRAAVGNVTGRMDGQDPRSPKTPKTPKEQTVDSPMLGCATLAVLIASYLLIAALPAMHTLGWVPEGLVYHTPMSS